MITNPKRLPDTEFAVMKAVWHAPAPVTSAVVMAALDDSIHWKQQTLLTILALLTEKGFLHSERIGRERAYTPLISEDEYLQLETGDFLKRYSGNPISRLVKTLFAESELSDSDLQELRSLLRDQKEG